jgi:hypothetical protein
MITHSAGFKHDYLPTARKVVKSLGGHTGFFHTVATDGCTALNEEELNKFDAIFFATSGELPISDKNKTDLINSIKLGKASSECTTQLTLSRNFLGTAK